MHTLIGSLLMAAAVGGQASAQAWPTEPVRFIPGQVLKDAEIVKRLADLGPITEGAGTPESLGQFLAAERARCAKLVRDVGIQPE